MSDRVPSVDPKTVLHCWDEMVAAYRRAYGLDGEVTDPAEATRYDLLVNRWFMFGDEVFGFRFATPAMVAFNAERQL